MTRFIETDYRWALGDGYWRVRLGNCTVYDWSLAEALASRARIEGYARKYFGKGLK